MDSTELDHLKTVCLSSRKFDPASSLCKFQDFQEFKQFFLVTYSAVPMLDVLELCIIYLNRFVQSNFVGPPLPDSDDTTDKVYANFVKNQLTVDYQSPYQVIRQSRLLIWAKWLLLDMKDDFDWSKVSRSADVWSLRCLFLWQKFLPQKSNALKLRILQYAQRVEVMLAEEKSDNNNWKSVKSMLYTELSIVYLYYFEYKLSEKVLNNALELTDLKVHLTGILGRKTKFQSYDVAQLVLNVSAAAPPGGCNASSPDIPQQIDNPAKYRLPTDCRLDDDTLLEQTKLSIDMTSSPSLSINQQCVLLALHKFEMRSKARDELSVEESQAYLDKILGSARSWSVQTTALFCRCRLEGEHRRKIDRCLNQLEELVNQFDNRSTPDHAITISDEEIENRLTYFFATDFPSILDVERQLAEVSVRLGAVRAGLDVYLRLCMWREAVDCYKRLDMLERAERLVRDRLEQDGETPDMLCLLGDITLQEQYYAKAWEISNHRYAEAQKRLAFLYFNRKLYDKAVECFKEATRLQPLQIDSWFTMGYCAVKTEQHALAADAYRRCVQIDPDNFEAWNNLASAYVNLHKREQAFQIMQEALKCNYENWRLWDNVVLLAAQLGHVIEAVQGLHRLLDLKPKYYDLNVLTVLVDTVLNESESVSEIRNVKSDLRKFFGRLTSSVTNDANLWRLYADLVESESELENYIRFRQRAHQCAFQKPGWEKDVDECRRVMRNVCKLSEAQLKTLKLSVEEIKSAQIKSSVRTVCKSVSVVVEKHYGTDGENLANEKLADEYRNLRNFLKLVE